MRVIGAVAALGCVLVWFVDTPAADAAMPLPIGLWLTADGNGVIRMAPCGIAMCASIVGIGRVNRGEPPPRDFDGHSECGLTIMDDLTETQPGVWHGHILNPESGGHYDARVWLDARGRLKLRGYLDIPLLGETQTWTAFHGHVAANCSFEQIKTGGAQR
jgi:uncharacterized protein (DUF2147 family)